MNVVLWIAAALLAVIFLMAGMSKLLRSKEQLGPTMAWVEDFDPWSLRAIAVAEVLGAVGLILPAATGILPWLTPVAAVGLALVMFGAMATHTRRREFPMLIGNFILLVLAAAVAYGRFVIVPL
ncbi:MAG: DoxX family protein [Chloroflexi bacterium]|nr:DoxX family protein [Chloroflexota bacterium]